MFVILSFCHCILCPSVIKAFDNLIDDLRGHRGRLQLPVQSMPITTKVVSSNPVHDDVYWMLHYVMKFVSDLRQVAVFSEYSGFLHQ
jgi:hypothetical protein